MEKKRLEELTAVILPFITVEAPLDQKIHTIFWELIEKGLPKEEVHEFIMTTFGVTNPIETISALVEVEEELA